MFPLLQQQYLASVLVLLDAQIYMEWMNRNLVILDNGNIYGTFI